MLNVTIGGEYGGIKVVGGARCEIVPTVGSNVFIEDEMTIAFFRNSSNRSSDIPTTKTLIV